MTPINSLTLCLCHVTNSNSFYSRFSAVTSLSGNGAVSQIQIEQQMRLTWSRCSCVFLLSPQSQNRDQDQDQEHVCLSLWLTLGPELPLPDLNSFLRAMRRSSAPPSDTDTDLVHSCTNICCTGGVQRHEQIIDQQSINQTLSVQLHSDVKLFTVDKQTEE